MAKITLVVLLFWISNGIIYNNCDEMTQTLDTYKICKIFQSLNMTDAFPLWNLTSNNYCDFNENGVNIGCINDNITVFEIKSDTFQSLFNDVDGTLNFSDHLGWPLLLKELKLMRQEIPGEFDFTSLYNLAELETLDLQGSFGNSVKTTGTIAQDDWNVLTQLPNLKKIDISSRGFISNISHISSWNAPIQNISVLCLYILCTFMYLDTSTTFSSVVFLGLWVN